MRVRNAEQSRAKEQLRQQRESEVAKALERNLQDKAQRENARSEVKQLKFASNAQEAQRLKEERLQHEEMIRLQRNAEVAKAQTMKQLVQAQKQEQLEVRRQEKELKRQQQRLDLIR